LRTWFKIALRNLKKNRRRSLITLLAIALGFASVCLFGGFTQYMYDANQEAAIYGRALGHLTVFKQGFLEQGQLDPARYLLTTEEIESIRGICTANPQVVMVTPQLQISGLVSNGKISTIFIAHGLVPSSIDAFMNGMKLFKFLEFEGRKLEDDSPYGVAVAKGLAKLLGLKVGSNAVVLSTTVDGQTNALDMEVFQLLNVDTEFLNNKVMRVPLAFAQQLYDTRGADRMVVLLDRTENTEPVFKQLRTAMQELGLGVEIKTWKQLSQWYQKVRDMFDLIFLFLFVIVFVIVVMSVVNTMSMAVLERTREIGTLRALGLKRRGVLLMFGIESSFLGVFGCGVGLLLTFMVRAWVNFAQPTWTPPGISASVPLKIILLPSYMVSSGIALVALCVLASLLPALRGSRQNIVDALGHV